MLPPGGGLQRPDRFFEMFVMPTGRKLVLALGFEPRLYRSKSFLLSRIADVSRIPGKRHET